jgi:flavin-dependent dehydrogenase
MKLVLFISLLFAGLSATAQYSLNTGVLVAGGGTGGTAAGIQSARSGAATVIVEETPWLGGMLSAAGVTATDGNNNLPSGLWQEFRKDLYAVYGGPEAVYTGWVSNTEFEPHVADSILKRMTAAEKNLRVFYGYHFTRVLQKGERVTGAVFTGKGGRTLTVYAAITIDATELGDVLADAGAAYDIGLEAASITHENAGVPQSGRIIQDLTYTAVLKDY